MATRITKRNAAVKPASNNYIDQTRMTYGEKEPLKELNSEVQNLNLGEASPVAAAPVVFLVLLTLANSTPEPTDKL